MGWSHPGRKIQRVIAGALFLLETIMNFDNVAGQGLLW